MLQFLAFIGAEMLFVLVSALIAIWVVNIIKNSKKLKPTVIYGISTSSSIISTVFLMLFLWILVGDPYFSVFMTVLVATVVLMLLAEFLWLISGEANVPWLERIVWHQMELDQLYPGIRNTTNLLALLVLLAYPVYVGVGYFGETFDSPRWEGYALRATLVSLVGFGWLATIPRSLYVIVCKNIADGTRSRIFISQLVHSVTFLMLLSFYVWSLEPESQTVPLVGQLIAVTPVVVYTTAGYILLILIVPYVVGHYRHIAWKEKLEKDRSNIVNDVLVGTRSVALENAQQALVAAKSAVEKSYQALTSDRSFTLMRQAIEGDEVPKAITAAARASAERDPRFAHEKKLSQLSQEVDDCLEMIGKSESEESKRKLLNNLNEAIKQQIEVQTLDKPARPLVLGVITTLVLAIVNPILTNLVLRFAADYGIPVE